MKTPIPTEDQEQARLLVRFRQQWPGTMIFAIPSGGHRHIATAARLQATGVIRGVPDLFIPAWRCWVEMKRQSGGRLSPDQKTVIAHLRELGYTVIVGLGCDDAIRQIEEMRNGRQTGV